MSSKTKAGTTQDERLTATRMTLDSLDRSIQENEKALRRSMANMRDRLDDAERALADGRMPNTCGIVQGLGGEIDGLVLKLDTAKTIRANLRAAAEFDKNHEPAIKAAKLC